MGFGMRPVRTTTALLLLAVLAVGCDSSDDGDGVPSTSPGGLEPPVPTATTLQAVLERGPTDEPLALDAAALSGDLESLLGGPSDEPVDVTEGEDIDTVVGNRRRVAN